MKRMIKASSFKNIEGYSFTHKLINKINELNPDGEGDYWAYDRSNHDGYQFTIEGPDSLQATEDCIEEALEKLGYTEIYDITEEDPALQKYNDYGVRWAVVEGEAWVDITIDYSYYYNSDYKEGLVYLKFDNGNVLFQDWYED